MKKALWVMLGLNLLFFFLTCYLTPLLADDFGHLTLAQGPHSALINIVLNLQKYYMTWGGRVIAHFVAVLLLSLRYYSQTGAGYALLNTLCFLGIVYFSVKTLFDESLNISSLALTAFLLFLMPRSQFQTLFWITGAANYLWMFFLLISFLYVTKDFFLRRQSLLVSRPGVVAVLGLFAFCVGATNENVGPSLFALAAFNGFLKYKKQSQFFQKKEFFVLLCLAVGTLFLILAPGNHMRAAIVNPQGTPWAERISTWVESLIVFLGRPDAVVYLLLLMSGFWLTRNERQKSILQTFKEDSTTQSLFIFWLLLCLAFLGNDGNFYGRKGLNAGWIFAFFGLRWLWVSGLKSFAQTHSRSFEKVLLALMIMISSHSIYNLILNFNYSQEFNAREIWILEQKQKGIADIVAPILANPYDLDDLSTDSSYWVNTSYARHLRVRSLTGKSE